MGADPVACAVLHAPGRPIDAFVVRKAAKAHGLQRQIEGAEVAGKRVLVVEDTSTTGGSALTAVRAVQDAGATVVGVATVVDHSTGAAEAIKAEGCPTAAFWVWPTSAWTDAGASPDVRGRS